MIKKADAHGADQADARSNEDRRKHARVETPLKARFLTENGQERACLISNISAGGALLRSKFPPPEGHTVVVYIDQLGRFEGKVIRSGHNCFAITYERKRAKNAKTADNLTQIVNHGQRATDRRKNPRIRQDSPAIVHLEDGRAQKCSILDISLTGASIEISPRPPLGVHLILGRMTAKVVRRHEKGVGVVFTGAAKRMEEVITETAAPTPEPEIGAQIAPKFGKKGADA